MTEPTGIWERFWDGPASQAVRLNLLRVFLFGLVGIDAFLQISHAPRYGAGGFNVSHLPWLDQALPLPGPALMLFVFLLQSYLAFRIALGQADRLSLGLLATLFGGGYFISQVDSYQHHYLLFLILGLSCLVPWSTARKVQPGEWLPSWALKLITVQISLLYLWAAVAKMDPHWLAGSTLSMQVHDDATRNLIVAAGARLGMGSDETWSLMAWMVMLGEILVAIGWQVRRLRWITFPLGLSFHVAVELLGYKIGLFSYFMMALYILMIPDVLMDRLARWLTVEEGGPDPFLVRRRWGMLIAAGWAPLLVMTLDQATYTLVLGGLIFVYYAAAPRPALAWEMAFFDDEREAPSPRCWALFGMAAAGGTFLFWKLLPITDVRYVMGGLLAVALVGEFKGPVGREGRAVVHLMACMMVIGVHLLTFQVRDYYRYMGGDARRRGETELAMEAYTRVTQISPDYAQAYVRLGDLYLRAGDRDRALAYFQQAVERDPGLSTAWLRLAREYDRREDGPQALAAATRVLKLSHKQKSLRDAAEIFQRWGGDPTSIHNNAGSEEGEDNPEETQGDDG